MREELFPLLLIGTCFAAFAVPAVIVLLLERIPGLRSGDGPQPQGAHSRSGGAFLIAGGVVICILGLILGILSRSFVGIIALPGAGLMLTGASGFARDERRSQQLDRAGRGLILVSVYFLMWRMART
jgi:hypothetical protein